MVLSPTSSDAEKPGRKTPNSRRVQLRPAASQSPGELNQGTKAQRCVDARGQEIGRNSHRHSASLLVSNGLNGRLEPGNAGVAPEISKRHAEIMPDFVSLLDSVFF